jgi:hypothetical protein
MIYLSLVSIVARFPGSDVRRIIIRFPSLGKSDDSRKSSGGFFGAIGKKIIRLASGANPAVFDVNLGNAGLRQLIPA